MHWVALASKFYFDDAKYYQVCDHATYLEVLKEMKKHVVDVSNNKKPHVPVTKLKEVQCMEKEKSLKDALIYLTHRLCIGTHCHCIGMSATSRKNIEYPAKLSGAGHGHL